MTHCRVCGVLDDVGDEVICEHCADTTDPMSVDYYSWYDIGCAALVLGLGIAAVDVLIVVAWAVVAI
jgi:hypothetical protein